MHWLISIWNMHGQQNAIFYFPENKWSSIYWSPNFSILKNDCRGEKRLRQTLTLIMIIIVQIESDRALLLCVTKKWRRIKPKPWSDRFLCHTKKENLWWLGHWIGLKCFWKSDMKNMKLCTQFNFRLRRKSLALLFPFAGYVSSVYYIDCKWNEVTR